MGKIRMNDFASDEWDDFDELHGGREKIKRKNNGKTKNTYEDELHESQRLPAGWREGDSFKRRKKKARN